MAARSISVSLRLGRLITENLVSNGKYKHYSYINQNFMGQLQSSPKGLCTVTSEEIKQKEADAVPVEETENEKKLRMEIEKLTKEVEILTENKTELENKYKRSLADGENLRMRLTKQIEDAKLFGIQGFCKDLLEVADILGKATESVPKEEVKESNPHLKNLYEGLTMTEAQLQKVFKRHGLEPVNPLDEKFDPNYHEALFQQEVKGKDPGTVVVVSKLGYKLHERVIRPALVGVAKG